MTSTANEFIEPSPPLREPNSSSLHRKRRQPSFSNRLHIPTTVAILLLLVTLPFGAVHDIPQAITVMGVSLLALATLWSKPSLSSRVASFFVGLLLLAGYVLLHSMILEVGANHPLGPSFTRSLLPEFFQHFMPGFTIFFGSLLIATQCIFSSGTTKDRLPRLGTATFLAAQKALLAVGIVVSLIALSHWLSDNGKLFWIFAPVYEGSSQRARWPFVNPNHLGFFLLPFFFLSLAQVTRRLSFLMQLFEATRHHDSSRQKQSTEKMAEVLGRHKVQQQVGSLGLSLVFTMIIFIAIIATLSRASWLGLLVGTVLFAILTLQAFSSYDKATSSSQRRFRRKKRRVEPESDSTPLSFSSSLGKGRPKKESGKSRLSLLVAFCFALFFIFISAFLLGSGEGQTRIESRFLYGLVSSHNDMRWQMFMDSVNLLSPFGIGVSRWDEAFQSVLSPGMAGLHPRYLHSEPFQTIIELGVLGFFLSAVLFLYPPFLLARTLKRYAKVQQPVYEKEIQEVLSVRIFISALLASWAAIGIAIFFDFSLRVPANLVLLATLTGLSIVTVDRLSIADLEK